MSTTHESLLKPLMDPHHITYLNTGIYAKTSADLRTLVLKEEWVELVRVSKDVTQTMDVKETALQYAVECLRNIADNCYRMVEKNRQNSTECANRILVIITSRTFQSLGGRDVILEYLGTKMIEMCVLDPEYHYHLVNIANNAAIRSNINLKALTAYYRLLFTDDGKIIDKYKTEIDYAVRRLNVRYINILLMTYDLDKEATEQIYLLLNYIQSKRD